MGGQQVPKISAGPRGPRKTVVDVQGLFSELLTGPDAVESIAFQEF
jgi:hypothetical protein